MARHRRIATEFAETRIASPENFQNTFVQEDREPAAEVELFSLQANPLKTPPDWRELSPRSYETSLRPSNRWAEEVRQFYKDTKQDKSTSKESKGVRKDKQQALGKAMIAGRKEMAELLAQNSYALGLFEKLCRSIVEGEERINIFYYAREERAKDEEPDETPENESSVMENIRSALGKVEAKIDRKGQTKPVKLAERAAVFLPLMKDLKVEIIEQRLIKPLEAEILELGRQKEVLEQELAYNRRRKVRGSIGVLKSGIQELEDKITDMREGLEEVRISYAAYSEARQELITSNLRLVPYVAQEFLNGGVEFADLVQEGTLGLMRATETYDPDQGGMFSTYAYYWIWQKMYRAIEDQSRTIRLPNHVHERLRNLEKKESESINTRGRGLSRAEIAEIFPNVSLKKLEHYRQLQAGAISIHTSLNEEGDSVYESFFRTENPDRDPYEIVKSTYLRERAERIMKTLFPREEAVLKMRMGWEGKEYTLEEAGQHFAVTRERIRQIEAKALRKMRHPGRSRPLKEFLAPDMPPPPRGTVSVAHILASEAKPDQKPSVQKEFIATTPGNFKRTKYALLYLGLPRTPEYLRTQTVNERILEKNRLSAYKEPVLNEVLDGILSKTFTYDPALEPKEQVPEEYIKEETFESGVKIPAGFTRRNVQFDFDDDENLPVTAVAPAIEDTGSDAGAERSSVSGFQSAAQKSPLPNNDKGLVQLEDFGTFPDDPEAPYFREPS